MKFCVIGLGRFGYQVAVTLAQNGMEVMAIDSDESIVASIRDKVTQAICMRVTDEHSLRSIGVDTMETVIVGTGENFAQSVLITALLKKRLNIPTIIARAVDPIHKDILRLVGASRVVLPEKESGIKLADMLSSPLTDLVRLAKNFSISHTLAPKQFIDKTIEELNLYGAYHVHCIGIQKGEDIIGVGPDYQVQENDRLILSGSNKQLEMIAKLH